MGNLSPSPPTIACITLREKQEHRIVILRMGVDLNFRLSLENFRQSAPLPPTVMPMCAVCGFGSPSLFIGIRSEENMEMMRKVITTNNSITLLTFVN